MRLPAPPAPIPTLTARPHRSAQVEPPFRNRFELQLRHRRAKIPDHAATPAARPISKKPARLKSKLLVESILRWRLASSAQRIGRGWKSGRTRKVQRYVL